VLLLGPGRMRRVEKYGRAAAAAGGDGTPGLAVPAGIGAWRRGVGFVLGSLVCT
jgi:hypothetical protein